MLRTPELGAALHVGTPQSRAEGQDPLPRPAAHAVLDAARTHLVFLGCECSLLGHVQSLIHQHSQVLFIILLIPEGL